MNEWDVLNNWRDLISVKRAARDLLDVYEDPQIDIGSLVWDQAVQNLRECLKTGA